MAIETERKFLVLNNDWRHLTDGGVLYWQGYIGEDEDRCVRIRLAEDKAFLTIKSAPFGDMGLSRMEFEYAIPVEDARVLLEKVCLPGQVRKKRYRAHFSGELWEIDEFYDDNAGLVLAEIELTDENHTVELPSWIGKEVSTDVRYTNGRLAKNPYVKWKDLA